VRNCSPTVETEEAQVLAHASGFSWDEALLVFGPLAVIVALLVVARRRALRAGVDEPAEQ
jgi:hypothetical protein